MKINFKSLGVLVFIMCCAFVALSDVSAYSKVKPAELDNLVMSLGEFEETSGYVSDGTIKITSPSANKTYDAGDSIVVKWNYAKDPKEQTAVLLINEETMKAVDTHMLESGQNTHTITVNSDMPSGNYFVLVGIDSVPRVASFDVSRSFKIKTKTKSSSVTDNAKKALAKSYLSSARANAELYYDIKGNYVDVCKKGKVSYGIKDYVTDAGNAMGKKADCDSALESWAAEVKLVPGKTYHCVDSTGYAGEQKKSKGSKSTSCVKKKTADTNIKADKGETATFTTSHGKFVISLASDKAHKTTANFSKLAKSGFYDGQRFHRVIEGFMIQGGDPLSKDNSKKNLWGTGGPGYSFDDEFGSGLSNVTGTISMANSGPDTNGSQFFINTGNNTFLDGKHAVFGKVISGMDVVMQISKVEKEARSDRPAKEVLIKKVEIK